MGRCNSAPNLSANSRAYPRSLTPRNLAKNRSNPSPIILSSRANSPGRLPTLVLTSTLSFLMSNPKTSPRPPVGRRNPRSVLTVVVFPAPLGPRKPNTSPSSTARSTSSIPGALRPYALVSFSVSIARLMCSFSLPPLQHGGHLPFPVGVEVAHLLEAASGVGILGVQQHKTPLRRLAEATERLQLAAHDAMPGSRLYPEIAPPLPRPGPPLHEAHLDKRPCGLTDGTSTRSQGIGQLLGRTLRRVGDHEHPQHPPQHPREPELPEQEPELLDVPTPLLVQRTSVEALRGPQHTPVFRKFQYLVKLLNARSVGLVSEYSFGLPRLLVGSEVLFDARSEGFLYLVL